MASRSDHHLQSKGRYQDENSSIIKVDNFILGNSPNSIVGEQGEISMIKAHKFTLNSNGKTSISGNLVFEGKFAENYPSWKLNITCATTGYDESKHSIESCSGIINGGNEGGDPSDPEFPIIVEDATNYTLHSKTIGPLTVTLI